MTTKAPGTDAKSQWLKETKDQPFCLAEGLFPFSPFLKTINIEQAFK